MEDNLTLKKIAVIHTDFPEKFGIPRQSGLTAAEGKVIFEPGYRNPDALKGIEEYSHLWLIWGFSKIPDKDWQPTVRPPRLGGNRRMGVFATRSPFRPNPVGLSLVELVSREETKLQGTVLLVRGVDMLDGTPVYDIKPYLPYVEAKEDAAGGFASRVKDENLQVEIPETWMDKREILTKLLCQDPRPAYQEDPDRVYGMSYAGMEIKFQVEEDRLKVCGIYKKVR